MQLISQIDEYKQQMSVAFQDSSTPYTDRAALAEKLLNEMIVSLQRSCKQYKLLGCPEDSFIRQIREVHFRNAEKARKEAEPDKPLLDDTIASAEDQQINYDTTVQDQSQQEMLPDR